MLIVGLTGSIGMGKTTVSGLFKELKVPVFDVDACVHELYNGEAVPLLRDLHADIVVDNKVDLVKLSALIMQNSDLLTKLEKIIHPAVQQKRKIFIEKAKAAQTNWVLIDIPLLYETNAQEQFDYIIVVSATSAIQRSRVLARPNMSEQKFELLLKRQLADAEKRKRADFIIDNSGSIEQTTLKVKELFCKLNRLAENHERNHI